MSFDCFFLSSFFLKKTKKNEEERSFSFFCVSTYVCMWNYDYASETVSVDIK